MVYQEKIYYRCYCIGIPLVKRQNKKKVIGDIACVLVKLKHKSIYQRRVAPSSLYVNLYSNEIHSRNLDFESVAVEIADIT